MPRSPVPTHGFGQQAGCVHRPASEPCLPTTPPSIGCPACYRAWRGEYPDAPRKVRTKQRRSFPRGLTPSNILAPYFAYLETIRRSPKVPIPSWALHHTDGY